MCMFSSRDPGKKLSLISLLSSRAAIISSSVIRPARLRLDGV